jgi:hypothetical protein
VYCRGVAFSRKRPACGILPGKDDDIRELLIALAGVPKAVDTKKEPA